MAALQYAGAGLVVDAQVGLVLVDRNTVPIALGNTRIEFASTVEVKMSPHCNRPLPLMLGLAGARVGLLLLVAQLKPLPPTGLAAECKVEPMR